MFIRILVSLLSLYASAAYASPRVIVEQARVDSREIIDQTDDIDANKYPVLYATYLMFEDFPINEDLTMSQTRLAEKNYTERRSICTFRILPSGQLFLEQSVEQPGIALYSIGFLPGEICNIKFDTSDGSFSHEISIVQNPLKQANGELQVEGLLVSLTPTLYAVAINGLKDGETFLYGSYGRGEEFHERRTFHNKDYQMFSLGNLGNKGEVARMQIKKLSGQTVELELPFGAELKKYAASGPTKLLRNTPLP
jgi:hypothetical protein